jgi:hypothetical protein
MNARQLESLKREAARRSLLKWWVEPEPEGPANLATIQPGQRARRPIFHA